MIYELYLNFFFKPFLFQLKHNYIGQYVLPNRITDKLQIPLDGRQKLSPYRDNYYGSNSYTCGINTGYIQQK